VRNGRALASFGFAVNFFSQISNEETYMSSSRTKGTPAPAAQRVRQAPAKSAAEANLGERRKGQDGKYWIVKAFAKGQRWVRQVPLQVAKAVKTSLKHLRKSVEKVASGADKYTVEFHKSIAPKKASSKKKNASVKPRPKVDRSNRPSPSVSATEYDVGHRMIGNDGMWWVIKADKNGTHRWAKV
jgi:hypothetical protein